MRFFINYFRRLTIALIALGVILLLGLTRPQETKTTPVYIAVMLENELTGEGNPFADSVDAQRGAELCAEQINQAGLNGSKGALELTPVFYYDEGNNTKTAKVEVTKMLDANLALAVVGHAFSNVSAEMGKLYKEHQIPAITASAVNDEITRDNEWYFRALPSSSMQSQQMAQYIYKVLESRQVTVIELQKDTFAQEFSAGFQSSFRGLGGKIHFQHSFPTFTDDKLTQEMDQIVDKIQQANEDYKNGKSENDPGVIVFAMRARDAALFIMEMRGRGMTNIMFGPSAFANKNFLGTFENSFPGEYSYSNGVFALAPVVYDTADDTGQKFLQDFRKKNDGDEPGMKAATNCDALNVLARAITNAGISGENSLLSEERIKLRDALTNIDTPAKAVHGVTGLIYFKDGNPVKPISVSMYQNGKRISAISQFVEINSETYKLLQSQTQARVLTYDNRYFRITDVVYVGVDINEVSEMDIRQGAYILDFYLWFRAREPINPQDVEFIQTVDEIEFGDPVIETLENEISFRAYRVKAKFKFKGDLTFKSYPFDSQTLGFEITHKFKNAQELLLVPDTIGMRGITESEFTKRLGEQNVIKPLGGEWQLSSPAKISQEESSNDSTLGNPNMVAEDTSIPYSSFLINFNIKRNGINYTLKNFLPMLFLVGLANLAFFSSANDYGKMYDVVTSVILTAAFFQLGLTDSLPNIGYTTAMDWMFYVVYFLCVLQIVVILIIKNHVERGDQGKAERLVVFSRFGYLFMVFLGVYTVYLKFWTN